LEGGALSYVVNIGRPATVGFGVREPDLTARELEVTRLLADGLSNKEIAIVLEVTPKTVMHHAAAIYRKLGVRGRSHVALAAIRQGVIHV
jgi:DNA-binding NarL/FixJ family response regulator